MNVSIDEGFDLEIKLLLIGDLAVGKTSLITKYVGENYDQNLIATAGVDVKKKVLKSNGKNLKITLFDIAGQARFRNLAKNLFKNVDGILVVYDVTDSVSKKSALELLNNLCKNSDGNTSVIIIGNKIDLATDKELKLKEGESLAKEFNFSFMETSARSGMNVEQAFHSLIGDIEYRKIVAPQSFINSQVADQSTIKAEIDHSQNRIRLIKKKNTSCCHK